ANELKRGELEMARTMAVKAFNTDPACKADAQAILRQIDAEVARRKQSEAATALNNALAVHAKGDFINCQAVLMHIDINCLSPEQKRMHDRAMADGNSRMGQVRVAGATDDDLKAGLQKLGQEVKAPVAPQTPAVAAPVLQTPPPVERSVADVAFDKL